MVMLKATRPERKKKAVSFKWLPLNDVSRFFFEIRTTFQFFCTFEFDIIQGVKSFKLLPAPFYTYSRMCVISF
jgi:hypothetical protein